MAKKKLTVFQKLNNVFTTDGINKPKQYVNNYSINDDVLLVNENETE